ncbi:MAG: T9SS C-terminal target domain-containing protein [Chitinophagaceae bacterium]|nr:MAG: T9SS C-terminal target domain-containing protein [Chitinophagaceae bacterium]
MYSCLYLGINFKNQNTMLRKAFSILFLSVFSLTCLQAQSTDTLFYDGFDNPSNWNLTGSTPNSNVWVINSVYQGGQISGIINIPNVPSQPATIQNPNTNYLHPANTSLAAPSGINNANYFLGLGGNSIDARNLVSINTENYQDVTVSFYRTGGLNGLSLIYSTDGGGTWLVAADLTGSPANWTQETHQLAVFDGHQQLRIGFRFNDGAAGDPAPSHYHSIDEVRVTGVPAAPPVVIEAESDNLTYCTGDTITVSYTVTGDIDPGNTFTAELSDANGDFTNPLVLGTQTGTTDGVIVGVIPESIPPGTSYRVRVNSSQPPVEGMESLQDITINISPKVNLTPSQTVVCPGDTVVLSSGGAATYSWTPTTDVFPDSGNEVQAVINQSTGFEVVGTSAEGCTDNASATINIHNLPPQPEISQNSNTLSVNNPDGADVQWYFDGEPISGANQDDYDAEAFGLYQVVITTSDGCVLVSDEFNYFTISVQEVISSNINVYPNPVQNQLNISWIENDVTSVHLINMKGQYVYSNTEISGGNSLEIQTRDWPASVYFLHIQLKDGKTLQEKIIVQ